MLTGPKTVAMKPCGSPDGTRVEEKKSDQLVLGCEEL